MAHDMISLQALHDAQLSEKSKKQYITYLKQLVQLTGDDLATVIANPTDTVTKINSFDVSLARKKAYINSLCALLKHDTTLGERFKRERELWQKAQKSVNSIHQQRSEHMSMSRREADNWVAWKDVLAAESVLADEAYGSESHLLLAMYCLIEPARADYGDVEIFAGADKPDKEALIEAKQNFMRISKKRNKSYVCLSTYKTSEIYGPHVRMLPDALVHVVNQSLVLHPRSHLFVTRNDEPFPNKDAFQFRVSSTFKKIFGKNVSVSLLRHSYVTSLDFNELTPAQLSSISKNMMHSIAMQQQYRRKHGDDVFGHGPIVDRARQQNIRQTDVPMPQPPATPSLSGRLLII